MWSVSDKPLAADGKPGATPWLNIHQRVCLWHYEILTLHKKCEKWFTCHLEKEISKGGNLW